MSLLPGRWSRWPHPPVLTARGVMLVTAACGFAIAALISVGRGWPVPPQIHDEMSYLLGADTFAHGRLSNPTPPFWEHFETFHVLMRPSYASKYPPAQALFLAAGQRLTGYPIVGVWLSTSVMCAALAWMLLGWVRPVWALWGSLVILLLVVPVGFGGGYPLSPIGYGGGYWVASYWGGGVPALGGALVYGGAQRITRFPSKWSAVLFAVGLGILFLSRPFEGGLVALPPIAAVGWWFVRGTNDMVRQRLVRVVIPGALVLGAIVAFSLAVNARVTGHVLRMPYLEYEAQYSSLPLVKFLPASDTGMVYRNDEMRQFYERQLFRASELSSGGGAARDLFVRMISLRRFLAPGFMGLLLLFAARSIRVDGLRTATLGAALVLAASLVVTWYQPHYVAPLLGPWALLLTAGARRLHGIVVRGQRAGAIVLWCIVGGVLLTAADRVVEVWHDRAASNNLWYFQRDIIARALSAGGQRHVVLVSYGPAHVTDQEWVYNAADMDHAPLIWARSLSAEKDAALIAHFRDRIAWRVRVNSGGGPYPLVRTAAEDFRAVDAR